jgi:hypothetical protein
MAMVMPNETRRRSLWVSAVLGGPGGPAEIEPWIRRLAGAVRRADEQLPTGPTSSDLTVDATFHVPGELLRPDYDGIRTGRWTPKKLLLVVQVAVPETMPSGSTVPQFVTSALLDAVSVAGQWAAARRPALSVARAAEVARVAALEIRQGTSDQ